MRRLSVLSSTHPRRRRAVLLESLESRRLFTTVFVDLNAPGPTHDGQSWATAYTDLQQALADPALPGQINVADGTYQPTATGDRAATFHLRSNLSLLGGFTGFGAPNPDARNFIATPTILSGDIGTTGVTTDNSIHIVTGSGTDATAVFDGFTVTSGNSTGATDVNRGSAMFNQLGSPTVTNSIFTASIGTAVYNDGRIVLNGRTQNYGASPSFTNCTFSNTAALSGSAGGGMENFLSNVTLTGCSFLRNSAIGGAGLADQTSAPAARNCIFAGNTANAGSAIQQNFSTKSSFTNCLFVGNHGGSVIDDVQSATVAYTNCVFASNSDANINSPVLIIADTTSVAQTITNCIIWGNTATSLTTPMAHVTYSDVQTALPGVGNISADPLFARAPSPGADGIYSTADDDYGDLRPQIGSPAIDTGSNAAVPTSAATDYAGNPRILLGVDTSPGSVVDMGAYELVHILQVPAGQTLTLATGGFTFKIPQLILGANSKLDLGDGTLIIDYTGASPIATIRSELTTGFHNGAWDGVGIQSSAATADPALSHALGYAEASDLAVPSINGQSLDTTAVVIRYTQYGDNNLDGTVDIGNDFSMFLDGYASQSVGWLNGDYTYDNKIDLGNDFNLFLSSYIADHPPAAPAAQLAIVAAPSLIVSPARGEALSPGFDDQFFNLTDLIDVLT